MGLMGAELGLDLQLGPQIPTELFCHEDQITSKTAERRALGAGELGDSQFVTHCHPVTDSSLTGYSIVARREIPRLGDNQLSNDTFC